MWRTDDAGGLYVNAHALLTPLSLNASPLGQMKDRGEMTYEERLEAAERQRLRGNALFQEVRMRLSRHSGGMLCAAELCTTPELSCAVPGIESESMRRPGQASRPKASSHEMSLTAK